MKDILDPNDLALISSMGITENQIRQQLEIFKKGTSFVKLTKAATVGNGIVSFKESEIRELISLFSRESGAKKVIKFVPASGAATRMFHQLNHFYLNYDELFEPEIRKKATSGEDNFAFLLSFINGIKNKKFAFGDDLHEALSRDGIQMEKLISLGQYKTIIEYLLTPKGLNYANLPKAVIKFHKYEEYTRAALEEHLVEGQAYARDKDDVVRVHFTLSPEFKEMISIYYDSVIDRYQNNGITFHIEFSEQKPSTNTVAVDNSNNLFRDEDNNLVLRPAGHGALLENVMELDADIIFIKNIDNIVPQRLLADTITYKKLLGGYLLKIQAEIFKYLDVLYSGNPGKKELQEISTYAKDMLYIDFPDNFDLWPVELQNKFLKKKLNRPLRVCGMVKNEGEPGGGPFFVKDKDGVISLQIVETAQINIASREQKEILDKSTHFNPVDLACSIRNFQGEKFHLRDFVDPDTYFILPRSRGGKQLKALEVPGLWNGAMAKWITIFVEVPLSTFKPVKTVNDLLKDEHQAVINSPKTY